MLYQYFILLSGCFSTFISFHCQIIFYLWICQFVHSFFDGHLSCVHFLAVMNSAALSICVQVFVWTCVFIYLRVELLVHVVTLFKFWGTSRLLLTVTGLFYILASSVWGFHFLHVLTITLLSSDFLTAAILVGVKW